MKQLITIFGILIISITSFAKPKDNVLDFEGEVIEGERQRPDLFLQITNKEVNSGDLIYLRDNFNDFLEVDRTMRPLYFKVRK